MEVKGGKDLWVITFDKKAKLWGPAKNLGPEINTPGNEMFPFINEKGDLFFRIGWTYRYGGGLIFSEPNLKENL